MSGWNRYKIDVLECQQHFLQPSGKRVNSTHLSDDQMQAVRNLFCSVEIFMMYNLGIACTLFIKQLIYMTYVQSNAGWKNFVWYTGMARFCSVKQFMM